MKLVHKLLIKLFGKSLVNQLDEFIKTKIGSMNKSTKTTAAGIAALVAAIALGVVDVLNGEVIDFASIFEALKYLGIAIPAWLVGLFARDADKSDQDEGLRPEANN